MTVERPPPNPIRVCVLLESYYPVVGGMEAQARNMAQSLALEGVELLFVTRRTSPDLASEDRVDDIPVFRVPPGGRSSRIRWILILTCIPTLIRKRKDYDIIFVPGLRALGIAAVLVAGLLRKRCVLKAESCGELSGEFFNAGLKSLKLKHSSFLVRLFVKLRNRLLARADAFVSMSSELTQEFVAHGVASSIIHRIPQTVDTERFAPVSADKKTAYRRELDLPANDILAIYTGRLVSYKGIPLLARVWEDICKSRKDATLIIVGAGGVDMADCEEELKTFVQSRGLEQRVIFTGSVSNVDAYLKASDIFVFPTENEAFGISLIEAMACGLPSISTSIGGIKDILSDRENGLLMEAGNREELHKALSELLEDRSLREALGQAALKTVESRYTRKIIADRYVDLFRKCLQ